MTRARLIASRRPWRDALRSTKSSLIQRQRSAWISTKRHSGKCCLLGVGLLTMVAFARHRPLEEYEIASMLWNDKVRVFRWCVMKLTDVKDSGIAARLVRSVRSCYTRPFTVWQMTLDRKSHRPYWWNFQVCLNTCCYSDRCLSRRERCVWSVPCNRCWRPRRSSRQGCSTIWMLS